jgi:ribonucleoside-diphosphate reductase alpha chain
LSESIPDNAEDRYEGDNIAEHRKKLPSTRKSLTYKFEIANLSGGKAEGYLTAGMFEDGTLGELFLIGLGAFGETLDGFAQWAIMDWSYALQHGAPLDFMCLKHAHMKFAPHGPVVNQDDSIPIPYCHSVPALIAEWCALRFGEKHGHPDLFERMVEIRENLRSN